MNYIPRYGDLCYVDKGMHDKERVVLVVQELSAIRNIWECQYQENNKVKTIFISGKRLTPVTTNPDET
jgi:hypothetical protein